MTCHAWDLDAAGAPPAVPALDDAAVLYSIAPGPDGAHDLRLGHWLTQVRGRPRRVVYLGTTGVYGDRGGATVTEHSPPAPAQPRSVRRLDAERRLAAWCAQADVELVILRLPAIYGPHRLPLERLRRGDPVPAPAGDAAPPAGYRIHVDDLVGAIVRALAPDVAPGVYLLRDDSALGLVEWFELVARLAGLQPPPRLPHDEARRRLSPAMLGFFSEDRRLDDRLSRAALGHRLRYPRPEAGVRASLAEMGEAIQEG